MSNKNEIMDTGSGFLALADFNMNWRAWRAALTG